MKKNYVLIDYENVQPDFMAALEKEHFNVIVFVGANQAKVTFEVASVLQQLGSRAEYIKISGNAAEYCIIFKNGQIACTRHTNNCAFFSWRFAQAINFAVRRKKDKDYVFHS
ncbi:MAG: PIN domain-containing protein [Pseudomonadales bacterium]